MDDVKITQGSLYTRCQSTKGKSSRGMISYTISVRRWRVICHHLLFIRAIRQDDRNLGLPSNIDLCELKCNPRVYSCALILRMYDGTTLRWLEAAFVSTVCEEKLLCTCSCSLHNFACTVDIPPLCMIQDSKNLPYQRN